MFAKWIYLNDSKHRVIIPPYNEPIRKLDILKCIFFNLSFSLFSYICRCIITSWIFEAVAIFVIVANSIVLALDINSTDTTSEVIDLIFLYIYTLEMAIKIIGLGFIIGKNSYL